MKRVLAIVKDQEVEKATEKQLEGDKYHLSVARTGYDGVIKAKSWKPDIVLCDYELPDMEGPDVLNELGSHGLLNFTPFIFIVESRKDMLSEMVLSDADAFIEGRLIGTQLKKVIKQVFKNKLVHIDELNQAQHEFNEKYLGKNRPQTQDELRKRLIMMQRLIPLIKLGRMSYNVGVNILDSSQEDIDNEILKANRFLNFYKVKTGGADGIKFPVKHIWLIDDDPTQNLLNRIVLKQVNPDLTIREFNSAERAYSALEQSKPDLIFLDINMPGMNGLELLNEVSKSKMDLNVIMLTSSVATEEIKKSLSYEQVINYFIKPIKRERVHSLVS